MDSFQNVLRTTSHTNMTNILCLSTNYMVNVINKILTLASGEEPKAPAKKRRMRIVQMLCEAAVLALKTVRATYVIIKMIRRPNISESEAQRSGPKMIKNV